VKLLMDDEGEDDRVIVEFQGISNAWAIVLGGR
jgi:hypothetical protein